VRSSTVPNAAQNALQSVLRTPGTVSAPAPARSTKATLTAAPLSALPSVQAGGEDPAPPLVLRSVIISQAVVLSFTENFMVLFPLRETVDPMMNSRSAQYKPSFLYKDLKVACVGSEVYL